MSFNIKEMDQSNWVCYQLPNNSYYFGQVGYLDQSGIVHSKDNNEAATNPKNKLVKQGFGVYLANVYPQEIEGNKAEYIYEGYWDKDQKNGKGYLKEHKIGITYEGNFLENHFHGNGKMSWTNGDSYEGVWKRSKMDGAGVFKHHEEFNLKGIFKANFFIDQDILRSPQMTEKQYITFKKQRKQILKQKQKQQKIKQGFINKISSSAPETLKQNIKKSIQNNRVPLVLSSKRSNFNLKSFVETLQNVFQNIPVNVFDLRKAYNLKGQKKWKYKQQIHVMFRKSLLNGEIFIVDLDESDTPFEEMFYPDVKQFYDATGFNNLAWSRDQLSRPEIKNKIEGLNGQNIHHNFKLIVWTKFKVDSSIKQDYLLQKLQTRYEKIIPFIKMDCILVIESEEKQKNVQ